LKCFPTAIVTDKLDIKIKSEGEDSSDLIEQDKTKVCVYIYTLYNSKNHLAINKQDESNVMHEDERQRDTYRR